jgi:hypothetical protein
LFRLTLNADTLVIMVVSQFAFRGKSHDFFRRLLFPIPQDQ